MKQKNSAYKNKGIARMKTDSQDSFKEEHGRQVCPVRCEDLLYNHNNKIM